MHISYFPYIEKTKKFGGSVIGFNRKFQIVFSVLCLLITIQSNSQSILIDGYFDDWTSDIETWIDPQEGNDVDIISLQITNDADYIYFHILLTTEIQLTSDLLPHNLFLYIDTDNNTNTGFDPQDGYGTELGINFKQRFAYYNVEPFSTLGLNDLELIAAPTITSNEFEVAVKRDVIPDNTNPLFPSNTIKVSVQQTSDGDFLPDNGQVITYTFNDSEEEIVSLDLDKNVEEHIRVLAYNVLFDGIIDADLQMEYSRILQAINPDVICFSECVNSTAQEIKSRLDLWIPFGDFVGWYVVKDDYDLITASKWPISQSWSEIDRQFPTLINLPEFYNKDLLITNSHLKCCDGNIERQRQVDEYAAFIRDVKVGLNGFVLEENTPIVYAGDLNLVGFGSQLETLLSGEIINTNLYGEGEYLDWDSSENKDVVPIHSDENFAFTWKNEFSDYTPSRIDYLIVSDAVMNIEKSYVLNTQEMNEDRLEFYNLNFNDTYFSSDHYPIIMDFSVTENVAIDEIENSKIKLFPNPSKGDFTISNLEGIWDVLIINSLGQEVFEEKITFENSQTIISNLSPGIYTIIIADENTIINSKIVVQ